MISTIPGSGALGRQLKMQFSRHKSQQPLLGLKKPSPRAGFAHVDSHKAKPCEAELCPGVCRRCAGAGAELCATDGSIGTCKGARSSGRGAQVVLEGQGQGQGKGQGQDIPLSVLGWLKDDGHWCLQSAELHLSPSYGLNPILCPPPPNHHFLLISAACKGLQVQRAAFEILTVVVGRTKQNCCPVCRKGGVCKLNKRVQLIIMMLVISVDGGKARALQSRLCSGRLSSFSKGEAGSPQIQTGLPDQIRGCDFPRAHLCARLLQHC